MANQHASDNKTGATLTPRFTDHPALLIAGLQVRLTGNPSMVIPALWQRFAPHIGQIPGQIGAAAYGLCVAADADAAACDYIAGCEVKDFGAVPDGWRCISIPAQRYAVFEHRQQASQLQDTVHAIFSRWLPASGCRAPQGGSGSVGFFERYGAGFNPDTGLGDIEVWVPIEA